MPATKTLRLPLDDPESVAPRMPPPEPKISVTKKLTNAKTARALLKDHPYEQQRPLRPWRVAELHALMETGHFREGTMVTFAVLNRQRHLINGQHTLTALGQTTGGPHWLLFEEYTVESAEEMGRLYASYDRNLPRTFAELYQTDASLRKLELPTKRLNLLGAVAPYLMTGFARLSGYRSLEPLSLITKDTQTRFAIMEDWADELENLLNGITGCERFIRIMLERAAVLAVALVTYRWQAEKAHRFWPRLARNSGLHTGEPEHTLLNFLLQHKARHFESALYARYVASAWNFFYNDRPVRTLQPRGVTEPICLDGTPHDGTHVYGYVTPTREVRRRPVVLDTPGQGA